MSSRGAAQTVDRLYLHPLLGGLRRSELRRWREVTDQVELDAGDVLLEEGRIGNCFFLIAEGTATRSRSGRRLGELGPGAHVGEVAILGLGPQPATVTATSDMRAFVVSRQHFLALAHDMPLVQRRLFPDVVERGFSAKLRELRAAGTLEWKAIAKERIRIGAALPAPKWVGVRPGRPSASSRPGSLRWSALVPTVFYAPRPSTTILVPRPALGWVARSIIAAAVAVIFGLAGWVYHPPMLVVRPLPAVDVSRDIVVTGAAVQPVHGRYLLLTGKLERPNGFGALVAVLTHRRRIGLGAGPATPGGQPNSAEAFTHSQQEATAAAAMAAGYDVGLKGTGATVVDPLDHTGPSELYPGDVIVAVEHQPVSIAPDVNRLATAHRDGPLGLTVERFGAPTEVTVARTASEAPTGALRMVLETRDPSFTLPFHVSFRRRPIGGPSGGLVYALALADMLDARDLAGGRTIAATGAIDPSGGVMPVGFVTDKTTAVRWARASELFVPAGEVGDTGRSGRPVRGVLTLADAIRALVSRR